MGSSARATCGSINFDALGYLTELNGVKVTAHITHRRRHISSLVRTSDGSFKERVDLRRSRLKVRTYAKPETGIKGTGNAVVYFLRVVEVTNVSIVIHRVNAYSVFY